METKKEEAIRKAWGLDVYQVLDYCMKSQNEPIYYKRFKDTGSVYYNFLDENLKTLIGVRNDIENMQGWHFPKSLKGIENNNGWIRIEGAKDFPDPGQYWVIDDDGDMFITDMELFEDMFDWSAILYYQPIVKPKPPLY